MVAACVVAAVVAAAHTLPPVPQHPLEPRAAAADVLLWAPRLRHLRSEVPLARLGVAVEQVHFLFSPRRLTTRTVPVAP